MFHYCRLRLSAAAAGSQTLSDGKPLIIEGMHLDPGLYIQDFGCSGIIMLPVRPRQPSPRLSPGAGGPGQPARR